MLRFLFSVTFTILSLVNCTAHAKEPLPKLCMMRAETTNDGTKILWLFDRQHMNTELSKYKMYDKEYGLPKPLAAPLARLTKMDGTKIEYSEMLSRGKTLSPVIVLWKARALSKEELSTYPEETLIVTFPEELKSAK